MKNPNIFSLYLVFFGLIPLREVRQRVCSSVCLALMIINSKVITKELLSPADLSGAQTLRVHEPTEVVMVGKYENLVFATF